MYGIIDIFKTKTNNLFIQSGLCAASYNCMVLLSLHIWIHLFSSEPFPLFINIPYGFWFIFYCLPLLLLLLYSILSTFLTRCFTWYFISLSLYIACIYLIYLLYLFLSILTLHSIAVTVHWSVIPFLFSKYPILFHSLVMHFELRF